MTEQPASAGTQPLGQSIRVAIRAAARLYGCTLVVAALMKVCDPWRVFGGLAAVGLEHVASRSLVSFVCGLESAAGIGLLLLLGCRTAAFGALVSAVLLVGHCVLLGLGVSDCGCYGNLRVADHWVLALTAFGGLVCLRIAMMDDVARPPISWLRGARASILASALLGGIPPWLAEVGDAAVQRVIIGARDALPGARLVVVGAWDCPHCRNVLAEVRAASGGRPDLYRETVFLVSDRDDQAQRSQLKGGWFAVATVRDSDWWRLIDRHPPTILRIDVDGRSVAMGATLESVWPASGSKD